MSSTAPGKITGFGGTRFTATFLLSNGLQVNISGSFSSDIQPFNSDSATLTYEDFEQLTAIRHFKGQIGVDDVKLTFTPGDIVLEGPLDTPISPPIIVSGNAVVPTD